MTPSPTPRSARLRWSTASELLRLVHAEPGIARTAAAERLHLASGAATELIERLRTASLLSVRPAGRAGPGRPTTVLGAHPDGPLTAVVDLRSAGWTLALGDLVGETVQVAAEDYSGGSPERSLEHIADAVAHAVRRAHGRVRAIVAAVAGTVSGTRLLQFSSRGWNEVDLDIVTSRLAPSHEIPMLAGNDATLAGIAEARTGASRGARVALHILVAAGVGGVLLVDGEPVTGARGAAGEYGHLPFGDPSLECPCGARGCWDLMVDGRALARHRGAEPPADPYAYGRSLLAAIVHPNASDGDRRAAEITARALGGGIAGLVNLHDPDVVTIAGLAPALRSAAPDCFAEGYRCGLMTFRRGAPPPVLDGFYGTDGPARGALGLGFDEITTPIALERWAAHVPRIS
ncbi:MAG: ROK family protein [Bifidobacteriaceae bacterium]|jgi:predicted NBD/HSP70 family sugar kinase|nr:ROK family protein [Bifidobacteriaceae bacterium]